MMACLTEISNGTYGCKQDTVCMFDQANNDTHIQTQSKSERDSIQTMLIFFVSEHCGVLFDLPAKQISTKSF